MRCQNSAQKLTSSHHQLCARCGSGAPKATEAVGPYPFKRTLLRSPLIHFSFDLKSISCTIVELKLNSSGIVTEVIDFRNTDANKSTARDVLT